MTAIFGGTSATTQKRSRRRPAEAPIAIGLTRYLAELASRAVDRKPESAPERLPPAWPWVLSGVALQALEGEIAVTRDAYVGAAVTGIAIVRAELSGPQVG